MKKVLTCLTAAALACFASCTKEANFGVPDNLATYKLGADLTRVVYNDADLSYAWENGDRVACWWSETGAARYNRIEAPFITNGQAPSIFSATGCDISDMGLSNKDYVVMYPYPATAMTETATYDIGAQSSAGYLQDKAFDSRYQIMRGFAPNQPSMLGGQPQVRFEHLLTSLRLYVLQDSAPTAYRNIEITAMEVYFPENVVGSITVRVDDGQITGATSDHAVVTLGSRTMKAYPNADAARAAGDFALITAKPFTLRAYNSATPAENRIVVVVKGTATTPDGLRISVSQTVHKTVSAARQFKAGQVTSLNLQLTNQWSDNETINDALPPSSTEFATGAALYYKQINGLFGYHCQIVTPAGEQERCLLLDNSRHRGNQWTFSSSSLVIPTATFLPGYKKDSGNPIIVEFDACALYGDRNEYAPIKIYSRSKPKTSVTDSGEDPDWYPGQENPLALQTVRVSNPGTMFRQGEHSSGYPAAAAWNHYSCTIRDASIGDYLCLRFDGRAFGVNETVRIAYIKNLKFSYPASN